MKRLLIALIVLTSCSLIGWGQSKVEVFTYHLKGQPLVLFRDQSCTEIGAILYPLYSEPPIQDNDLIGYIVHIVADCGDTFRLDSDGMDLFIKKGEVAINTRNYDGASLLLYEDPDRQAPATCFGNKEKTVCVYGVFDGWVYVEIQNLGSTHRGWLPPEMICGNPFTPCS